MLSENILIPLSKSSNATNSFSLDNLIQRRSYKRIKQLIEKNIQLVESNLVNNQNNDRYHEAITILGERGSGKTSFLLNLEGYLKNDKIVVLKMLDPTLFENKQNVMLTIITIILDYVNKNKDTCQNEYKKSYEESLEDLANGLNLLDGIDSEINHKSVWDDSRINFNKGLGCALDSIEFELNFKLFIKNTLKYLNKTMFILMFDDIDTNIEKGWPVLEVIRKYLTMLELQVIVSGDWNLFCQLVRVKQLENLKGLKDIEEVCKCDDKRYNYLNVLDKLEEQYLTKILKPENRIMLQNLASISKSVEIQVCKSENLKPTPLYEVYHNILRDAINANRDSKYEYLINVFLTLPLRSNIQLLNAYYTYKDENDKLAFINEISKQFLTQLSMYGITLKDLNDLEESNSIYHYLMKALEIHNKFNIRFDKLLDLSSLNISENMNENIMLFVFKSYLTAIIQIRPYLTIEWMYKVELFKHIYASFNSLETDMRYLGYYLDVNPFEFVSRINGYLLYQDDEIVGHKKKIDGFASVYKDKSKMGVISYDHFYSEVNKLEDKDSYKLLTSILFNKIRQSRESKTTLYGSIHMTLGFLFDLIKFKYESKDIISELAKLQVFSGVKPYSNKDVETFVYYDNSLDAIDLQNSKLVQDLISWLQKFKNLKPFSLELLSETMREFHYQSSDIIYYDSFGKYITLQIVYFLNALLKANVKYYKKDARMLQRIRSYSNAIKALKSNIKLSKIEDDSSYDNATLFHFFYECPIWNYLITLHGFKESKTAKSPIEDVPQYGQRCFDFGYSDNEIEENVIGESVIFENKFFELLTNLEIHVQDAPEKDGDESSTPINKTYKIAVEDFVKIFKEHQTEINDYKIQDKNNIKEGIRQRYIDILKKQYKKRVQFRSKHTKPILDDAIVLFSNQIGE